MDLDGYMLQLNIWRKAVEARLAALEVRPSAVSGAANGAIAALDGRLTALERPSGGSVDIAALETRLTAVEAKASDANSILAKVEAALNVTAHEPVVPGTEPPNLSLVT